MGSLDFSFFRQVQAKDAFLRNAIRLESEILVRDALANGANINCQYPDDWNTPLQMALASGCQPIVELLMSHNPEYRLVNGENLTAAEMSIKLGKRALGRGMIEAEFAGCDPVDALYELLKRRSLEALEMLVELLDLSTDQLAECLARAWNKLELMNVQVEPELELFVYLTLVRIGYEEFESTSSQQKMTDEEVNLRMLLVLNEIESVDGKFDTGMCDDVNDEFLERLRLILRQLFVLKNRIEYFPVLQLEYCIAIYLAIFDRRPDFDLFQLAINKRLVIKYLLQLKQVYEFKPTLDRRMSTELLYSLSRIVLVDKRSKCKQVLASWKPIVGNLYKVKELIMIRNRVVKGSLRIDHFTSYSDLGREVVSILKLESDSINKMFETRKNRYHFKSLFKLYFRLKQMYSLQKCIRYLQILEKVEIIPSLICFSSALVVQRVLQVVGETLKSTKLSPNISTNLRSTLEFASPADVLNRIVKLRNYFSHDYSTTKHSVYTLLRENDTTLIEMYKKTQADLLKITPLIDNILKYEYVRYVKTFLGYALQLKPAQEVRSYAMACRVSYDFKLNASLNISDLPIIENILNKLRSTYCTSKHKEKLDIIAKIKQSLKYYQQTMTSVAGVTALVVPSIGSLIMNDKRSYQHNMVKFLLKQISSPQGHEYGVNSLIMYNFNADIHELIAMETKHPDDRSHDRLTLIHELLKLAVAEHIGTLHSFTLGKENPTLNVTKKTVQLLELQPLTGGQLSELDKSLSKYYLNLFSLDDKYRTLKTFCKRHKLRYNNELAIQSRRKDEHNYQNAFNDQIQDISRLVSIPQEMGTVELVKLVAAYQKLLTDSPDVLAIEIVLLEVLDILTANGVLQDNRAALSSVRPVITGRNLRNYLAHDSLVYDVLCRNQKSYMTVVLNAICLTKYVKFNVFHPTKKKISTRTPVNFEDVHDWKISLVLRKTYFFELLSQDEFQNIDYEKFECKSRLFNNGTVLETVMDIHSQDFIAFLIGRESPVLKFYQQLLRYAPDQVCNFYDEDSFVFRDVTVNAALRQHMSFYMALKYKHYDLEDEIAAIYGTIYEADSLSIAILFGNVHSALSVINSSNLYEFCTAELLRHDQTVLMMATLYKLPSVVRAICEKSPEMLECTNTSDESALFLAVGVGCKEIVEILLEFGAKRHHPTKSTIISALSNRKDDILEMLLPTDEEFLTDQNLLGEVSKRASLMNHHVLLRRLLPLIKESTALVEALTSAASQGHHEAVDILLSVNPSIVNEPDSSNETALFNACYARSRRTVELLLRYGANCNLPNRYPALDYVVDKNQTQILKLFLGQGINEEHVRDKLFEKVHRIKPKMAWMVFKAGYPLRTTNTNLLASTLRLYLKIFRSKPEFIQQINSSAISKAILLENHEFVKCVLDVKCSRLSTSERGRLINSSVKANNKEMLNYLISIGCEVDQPDEKKLTPLGLAVIMGKPDLIRILLKAGANPNVETTSNGPIIVDSWSLLGPNVAGIVADQCFVSFPIILAIALSQNKIVDYLVQHGANLQEADRNGVTPLIGAILAGNVSLVEQFVSRGANIDRARQFVDSMFHRGTVLHHAAEKGHVEVFQLLMERFNFDIDVCDSQGNTVLHTAIMNARVEIVRLLRESNHWNTPNKSGEIALKIAATTITTEMYELIRDLPGAMEYMKAFRDKEHRSMLHLAVELGRSTNFLEMLIAELEPDINGLDGLRRTPLHFAMVRYDLELVKFLVSRGASLDLVDEHRIANFLVRAVLLHKYDTIRFGLEHKAFTENILNVEGAGCSLLDLSIYVDSVGIFQMLLDLSVFDVNATIHFTASVGSVRMMALLLREGADLENVNREGKTPLVVAIENGHWKMSLFLLSKGASKQPVVEYRYAESSGMNVLHYVASHGRLASLQLLLDQEFFVRATPDDKGRTIGHYAAGNNQTNVIDFLVATMFPLDMEDEDGRSSLIYAIEFEHFRLARRLIFIGSSLKVVRRYNETHSLLQRAINDEKVEIVNFLKMHCNLYEPTFNLSNLFPDILKKSNESKAHKTRLEFLQKNKITEMKQCIANDGQPLETVDSLGRTLLHEAVLSGNFEAVKTLLELSMPLDLLDKQGTSPLILAIMKNNRSLAKYLINAGSSTDPVIMYRSANRDQSTLLHIAAQHGLTSSLELLLQLGIFDVDIGDFDHTTALHEAASRGHKQCIELLLQHGADAEFVDLQGTNALTRAFCGSQEEIVWMLLERPMSLGNSREFRVPNSVGESLLHLVAANTPNSSSLIDILVGTVGIDVNVLDDHGRSALHYATAAGLGSAVEHLLKNGATRDIPDEKGAFPLITAIQNGHGNELAELFLPESVEDVEILETYRAAESQKTVLHIALEQKCYRLLELLINDYRIDCSLSDLDGNTVLHCAAAEGSISQIAQITLDCDNFFVLNSSGKSPLSICVEKGDQDSFITILKFMIDCKQERLLEIFEILISHRSEALLNQYSKWLLNERIDFVIGNKQIGELFREKIPDYILEFVAMYDNVETLKLLIASGIDRSLIFEYKLPLGVSLLHVAAMKNFDQLAITLIKQLDMPVNASDENKQTPLAYAVHLKHLETVKVLLENNANVNCLDKNGRCPLLTALEHDHKELVQLLLSHGADIILVEQFRYNSENIFTPLHFMAERGLINALPLVLLSMSVDCTDVHGMTPLHYAAATDHRDVIDLLVSAGCTIDAKDKHDSTPLLRAVSKGNMQAFEQLGQYGADLGLLKSFRNVDFDGGTMLHITAEKGLLEMTKLLVEELGLIVDCQDKDGNTPLHCAIGKSSFVTVKYLLSRNANVSIENGEGKTALGLMREVEIDLAKNDSLKNYT